MPVCHVCGEDEYYVEDGFFFCTVCNTQSQSMVVMEQDDTYTLTQTPCGSLKEIRGEKQSREKRSDYEAGRPWTRYEAYQLVLQGQADALKAHGAHPSVKEVVQRLYFAYLSKLEVAFAGENKTRLLPKGLERSKHTGWHRELHRGGMEHPEINLKAMKHKISKSQIKTRNVDELEEQSLVAAALEGETFYEGDNPLEDNGDSDDSDYDSDLPLPMLIDSDLGSSDDGEEEWSGASKSELRLIGGDMARPKSYRLGKQGVLFDIRYMNLRKTLSFLYAACLFASPWITVSDILRWVSDGSLPYLETTHLLPSDMKLSSFDHHLFRPSLVSSEPIRLGAGCLLRFLNMELVPEFLVKDIAIRYTLALDLPEAVVPCVVAVIRRCPVECSPVFKKEDYRHKAVPNVDALCAAYILVALKAIFGLDDHRERILSDYTKEVQTKVDVPLFDWQEWQWHATQKFLVRSDKVPSAMRLGEMAEVETLCRTFESAQYKDQSYSHHKLYHKLKKAKVATFKQEKRDMLKRPSSVLEERWKNRDATAARIRVEEHSARTAAEEKSSHTAEGDTGSQQDQAVRFRTSSIEHLIHAEDFLHSHLGQGRFCRASATDGKTMVGSEDAGCSSSAPSTGDESSSSSSGSGLRVKRVRKRKRRGVDTGNCQSAAARDVGETRTAEDLQPADDDDDASRLLDMHSRVRDDYWVSPQQTGQGAYSPGTDNWWWREQPCSYKWLLRVLSRQVRCRLSHVQRMVCHVEQGMTST